MEKPCDMNYRYLSIFIEDLSRMYIFGTESEALKN